MKERKDSVVDQKEMVKKDLMIKDLKEQMANLKMENKQLLSQHSNMNNAMEFRNEISKADWFLRQMIKDNISTYSEKLKDSETNDKVALIPREKSKLFDKSYTSYNCKCTDCVLNSSYSMRKFKKNDTKISKHLMISKNVYLAVAFNGEKYAYENYRLEDSTKKIILKSMSNSSNDVELNFTMTKVRYEDKNYLNFAENKILAINNVKISPSALIIVDAMRAMEVTNLNNRIKSLENLKVIDGVNTCFADTMKNFVSNLKMNDTMWSVSDMVWDDEVEMLMNSYNKFVYVSSNLDNEMSNHISIMEFKFSTKIPLYTLITPQYRNVIFFSYAEENDMLREDMASMTDEDKDISTSSNEGVSIIKPKIKLNNKDNNNYKMTFNIEKNIIDIMMDSKMTIYHDMITRNLKEKIADKDTIEIMEKSVLFDTNTKSNANLFLYLKLYHMTFNEFRTIIFLTNEPNDICNLVLEEKLTIWIQMHSAMYIKLFTTMKVYKILEDKDITTKFNEFMNNLDMFSDLNSNMTFKMFEMFKKRILDLIVYKRMTASMNMYMLDDRELCICVVDRNSEFTEIEKMRKMMMLDKKENKFTSIRNTFIPNLDKEEMTKIKKEMADANIKEMNMASLEKNVNEFNENVILEMNKML
jgi:hypothetical protein